MSNIKKSGESGSIELKNGVNNVLNFNRPVKYTIKTAGGSIIKGIITPNNPLIINPADDLVEFNIDIDDESTKKLEEFDDGD